MLGFLSRTKRRAKWVRGTLLAVLGGFVGLVTQWVASDPAAAELVKGLSAQYPWLPIALSFLSFVAGYVSPNDAED